MKRTLRSLAVFVGTLVVLIGSAAWGGAPTALATHVGATGWQSYKDPVYGYSVSYPPNWHLISTASRMPVFISPGKQSACQVNVDVARRQGSPQMVLSQAVPSNAVSSSRGSVDGAAAVTFHQNVTPGRRGTGSIDATLVTTAIAQPIAPSVVNLYTLSLIIYRTSPLATAKASSYCAASFHIMVQSLVLAPVISSSASGAAPAAVTNWGSTSVSYAENTWQWWDYTGYCCAPEGQYQPNFQCAEFVARALSTQGLVPHLSTSSPQSEGTGVTSPYNYDYYAADDGSTYRLLDTGTGTITGLYQYLTGGNRGVDIGDNPASAVPGDVVFYFDPGGTVPNNLEHVALLVATGSTVGGSDTLIDQHNAAGHQWSYASIGYKDSGGTWHYYGRAIVHLYANSLSNYEVAFQANTGNLWTVNSATGGTDTLQGMMPGTSPSITKLSNGGYEMAFQANTGNLYTVGSDEHGSWNLGMMSGTSPSITTLSNGGYEVAFQANTSNLWTVGSDNHWSWNLGMMSGTSPSIIAA